MSQEVIFQDLFDQLFEQAIKLITTTHKNMKDRLMPLQEWRLVRKRSLIETINDQLKNTCTFIWNCYTTHTQI